ncbi:hypothetical protein KY334_05545, partial [Candidatus Woesearchaeota archaeon]|nr:hypothetical protein [Candidatus Woesearchaeota archaeon]
MKNSEQYKNYRITLVGNIIWKDLALSLDSQFINDFIFIDRRKFSRNLSYRYNKLKEISSKSFEIILNPIYSRDFFHTDTIVKLANAKYKIGSIGNLSNITVWQKKLSDKYYTKLISANDELIFEFYRNKEFFENFLGENLEIKKTYINLNFNVNIRLPQNYVILFLGASAN